MKKGFACANFILWVVFCGFLLEKLALPWWTSAVFGAALMMTMIGIWDAWDD